MNETPLWATADKPGARYEEGDLVRTESISGRVQTWRCLQAHRPSYKRSPLGEAGRLYWEEVR